MELEEIKSSIKETWCEDEDDSEAFARIIIENVDPAYHKRFIQEDLYFNRYNGVTNYEELAEAILNDEWDDDSADYLEIIEKALKDGSYETILIKDGWHIDTEYGGAIGFDGEVLIKL